MKCTSCGFEEEMEFSFCPQCGAAATQELTESAPVAQVNPAAEKVLQIIRDRLFLVVCILMSVSCGVQLIGSGPNVLSILFTIFLWLTYAQGRKGIADAKHLRCISGTVYAQYIIVNVGAILMIVVGGLLGLVFGALVSDTTIVNEVLSAFEMAPVDTAAIQGLLGSVSGAVIFVIFGFVGAAMLVVNLFSNRYIHRFAKSVYTGVESGNLELKHTKAAYTWLYIFGIASGISLLGSLGDGDIMVIAGNIASCAMPILAAVLIKNYLMTEE